MLMKLIKRVPESFGSGAFSILVDVNKGLFQNYDSFLNLTK